MSRHQPCHRCGHPWDSAETPGFNNICESCGMALHCCANCDHYRSSGSERCSVPDTPRVLDAAASNQCVSFAFRSLRVGEASQAAAQAGTDAKVRDFLLSESEEGAQAARADRKTWDQLFG